MRQVLLVRKPRDDSRSSLIVLWMGDTTRVGDGINWEGDNWVVSAVYGTHFCASTRVARRDKPYRLREDGDGSGSPSIESAR